MTSELRKKLQQHCIVPDCADAEGLCCAIAIEKVETLIREAKQQGRLETLEEMSNMGDWAIDIQKMNIQQFAGLIRTMYLVCRAYTSGTEESELKDMLPLID